MIIRLPIHLVCSVTMLSAVTNYAAAQADACAEGYAWREAFDGDHVCVGPGTREQVKSDNANAAQRRVARDRDECIEGFVWRLANDKDHVCVPQMTREQAARDNELASTRLASGSPELPPRKAAVPLPPAKIGCHVFKGGEWRETPCATEEERKGMVPPVAVIQNRTRQVPVIGGFIPWRPAIKFARIVFRVEIRSHSGFGDRCEAGAAS